MLRSHQSIRKRIVTDNSSNTPTAYRVSYDKGKIAQNYSTPEDAECMRVQHVENGWTDVEVTSLYGPVSVVTPKF